MNKVWKNYFESARLFFSGYDERHEVRAFELPKHPFFIGTLFQSELTALNNIDHPITIAFIKKASEISSSTK